MIEFSTPGAVYERKLSARMSYTDINNQKSLTVSTEKLGKTGALKVRGADMMQEMEKYT